MPNDLVSREAVLEIIRNDYVKESIIAAISNLPAAGDERWEKLRDDFTELKEAAWAAHRDIGEWVQLACHQQQASADYTHDPLCATDAGLSRSQDVRARLVGALAMFADRLSPPQQEAGDEPGK